MEGKIILWKFNWTLLAGGGSIPHPNKPAIVSIKCCYGVLVVGTANLKLCMADCMFAF